MMGALDQKYELAISALHREARNRRMSFKEMMVRLASEKGLVNFPLWNEEFDAQLVERAKGGA